MQNVAGASSREIFQLYGIGFSCSHVGVNIFCNVDQTIKTMSMYNVKKIIVLMQGTIVVSTVAFHTRGL